MDPDDAPKAPSVSELPIDELIRYGTALGLHLPPDTPHAEALRLVRRRQELLVELDRDAMLDVVRWLRHPVRRSAGKEQLAQLIAADHPVRFDGLSDRGLHTLARLSGVDPSEGEARHSLEARLRKAGGLSAKIRRLRRRALGSLVAKIVSSSEGPDSHAYRYLPEDGSHTLRSDIEQTGLVSGVARRLRGAADDYVREKLDDIEKRIDVKLDEIDRRLGEWRDREVAHRLLILKLTLVFSILVALLSLLYDRLRS